MSRNQVADDVRLLKESLGELPEPVVRPALVVVSGLPGTGKSYFCRRLSERVPLAILESDSLRKVMFPSPCYSREESLHLFQTVYKLLEGLLREGITLALDATNLEEHHRERLYYIADQAGAKLIMVRVDAPPEVVYQRLEGRLRRADPSDHSEADWEVYNKMRFSAERIGRNHFTVDTSKDIAPIVDKIVHLIDQ